MCFIHSKTVFELFIFVLLVCPFVCCDTTPLPEDFIKGVAIAPGNPIVLSQPSTLMEIEQALDIGCNWILVDVYLAQRNSSSNKVTKGPQTPSDNSLANYVSIAKDKGLKVLLKPLILPLDGSSWIFIDPSNPDEWFESYTNILRNYTQLLHGLDALSIGLELESMTIPQLYTENWKKLIKDLRSSYGGLLTYSSVFLLEWERVTFWEDLDWIGIDEYYPTTSPSDPYPPQEQMVDTLVEYFDRIAEYRINNNLTSKPVVFTEMGCYSYSNATFSPANAVGLHNCTGKFAANFTTQEQYFEVSFEAIQKNTEMIKGVFVFHFDNLSTSDYCGPCGKNENSLETAFSKDKHFGHKYPCGLTVRGKPSLKIVKKAFAIEKAKISDSGQNLFPSNFNF